MSKTFKNATNSGTEVYVGEGINTDSVQLIIRNVGSGIGKAGIYLNSSDIPALALAVLEAAGAHKDSQDFLGGAVEQLKFHIGEQERITAEARERAELEAEALMLANSAVLAVGNPPYPSIEHMSDTSLRKWLAVARRARELAKEATK